MANKVNFYKSDKPEELRDFYQVLGITQTASEDEIKKAYRAKARETHPDLHPEMDTSAFQEVEDAKEVLSDKEMRASYDKEWASYQEKQEKPKQEASTKKKTQEQSAPKKDTKTKTSQASNPYQSGPKYQSTSEPQKNTSSNAHTNYAGSTNKSNSQSSYTSSQTYHQPKTDYHTDSHDRTNATNYGQEETVEELLHRYANSPSRCAHIRKSLLFDQIMSDFHLYPDSTLSMMSIPLILRQYLTASWDTMNVVPKVSYQSTLRQTMADYYFYPSLITGGFHIINYTPIYRDYGQWFNSFTGENLMVQNYNRYPEYTRLNLQNGACVTIFPLISIMPYHRFQNRITDLTKAYTLGNECFGNLWMQGYVRKENPYTSYQFRSAEEINPKKYDSRVYQYQKKYKEYNI